LTEKLLRTLAPPAMVIKH